MKKKMFCIFVILFFVAAILGDANQKSIICRQREASASRMDGESRPMFLSADSLQEMDDFQIMADANGTGTNLLHAVRGSVLVFLAAVLCLIFGFIVLIHHLCCKEKKIFGFRIISFIHRTDGKKKSCFVQEKQNKTGGFKSEGWYKI